MRERRGRVKDELEIREGGKRRKKNSLQEYERENEEIKETMEMKE